jgi:hypothetical protein
MPETRSTGKTPDTLNITDGEESTEMITVAAAIMTIKAVDMVKAKDIN